MSLLMSFVSIAAKHDYISIVSDGRITTDGVASKEDFQKFEIYNSSFIAFTGHENYCLAFKDFILDLLTKGENYDSINKHVKNFLQIIRENDNEAKLNIAFGGKDNGVMKLFFNNTRGEYEDLIPGQNYTLRFLGGEKIFSMQSTLNLQFRSYYKFNKKITNEHKRIKATQIKLLKEVAKNDATVNDKPFIGEII
jgi:hypothetical protein